MPWRIALERVGWRTPQGGVGPMTIAMLLRNTLDGAIRAQRQQQGGAAEPDASVKATKELPGETEAAAEAAGRSSAALLEGEDAVAAA